MTWLVRSLRVLELSALFAATTMTPACDRLCMSLDARAANRPLFSASGPPDAVLVGILTVGDLDEDELPDFAVGYQMHATGLVVVYSGRDGSTLRTIPCRRCRCRWLSAAGDLDGDGLTDILVDGDGYGRIAIISPGQNDAIGELQALETEDESTLAVGIGDIDGDARADLAVKNAAQSFQLVSGRTLLPIRALSVADWASSPSFPRLRPIDDLGGDQHPDLLVWANHNEARVYCSATLDVLLTIAGRIREATSSGDVNGDGVPDIMVSMAEEEHVARVNIMSGLNGDLITSMVERDDFFGCFGSVIAGVGDVNGDGSDDVVLGDWSYDRGRPGTDYGRAIVCSGRNGKPMVTLLGWVPHGQLGSELEGIGDLNKDGRVDLLVGANSSNGNPTVFAFGLQYSSA